MPNRWSRGREGEERESWWEKPRQERWREERSRENRWERESQRFASRERLSDGLEPLPRPGFDADKRLEQMNDDPRYHPGAELGKAQKAAMGIKGLHGRNTASFDPRSTLVRPAMRVVYGRKGHDFGNSTKPDDVVVVPELICSTWDDSVARRVIAELKPGEEPKDIASIKSLTMRMCQYFDVDQADALVRVRWQSSPSGPIFELSSKGFSSALGRSGCTLHLSLGGSELAFKRCRTGEVVYFQQENGTVTLLGRDIDTKWAAGERKLGILISVRGSSGRAEEDQLAETVSSATKEMGEASESFRIGC